MDSIRALVARWRQATGLSEPEFQSACVELEGAIKELAGSNGQDLPELRLGVRMVLGNLHRDRGLYREANEYYESSLSDAELAEEMSANARNEAANLWSNRGICRMVLADQGALEDFERAIRIRRSLPLDENPSFRWGLSAAWINRGDVLASMDGRGEEAVMSYDEGIAELERMTSGPFIWQRLAVAWNNRGLVLESMGRRHEATESFRRAVGGKLESGDEILGMAVAAGMVHLSRLGEDWKLSMDQAKAAMQMVEPMQKQKLVAAEIVLKARHQICTRLCEALESSDWKDGDWIAEACDQVEEGLLLERSWEVNGIRVLRPVAADLFRLGLRIYRVCQPHFLAEFILEALDPARSPGAPWDDRSFQAAAAVALKSAFEDAAVRGVRDGAERGDRELAILGDLQAADRHLAGLQRRSG